MNRIKKLLYLCAKTGWGGWLLHWTFAHFTFLVPPEKLIETESLLAFHHPQPAYPLHILIVPKSKYKTLNDLPSDDQQFESDLFQTVNRLVKEYDLTHPGYRLIVNGGKNQEIPHLHFHLISESGNPKEDQK